MQTYKGQVRKIKVQNAIKQAESYQDICVLSYLKRESY